MHNVDTYVVIFSIIYKYYCTITMLLLAAVNELPHETHLIIELPCNAL